MGKLPGGAIGLASQPTMSRWENVPKTRELVRMMDVIVDLYCASYRVPPAAVTLDIDETVDVVHGGQQLSFWNGHCDERCFLPLHVYDTATGRPVAMLLRTDKTPFGAEFAGHIRRLHRRIKTLWPKTRITLRGDGHYSRPEIMAWCETNEVDNVFGLPGNRTLHAGPVIVAAVDAVCVDRATRGLPVPRRDAETRYAAKSWGDTGRRVVARIETSTMRLDIRFVVTSLNGGSAEHIYDTLYSARGQAQNLIKLHKIQLKSDRTSCRSANANQMRLFLHTAAYSLMWSVRQALPQTAAMRTAEFATIRSRPMKVAARIVETATRLRITFASACPDAALFRHVVLGLRAASPYTTLAKAYVVAFDILSIVCDARTKWHKEHSSEWNGLLRQSRR